jgi:pyrroloquinoline quinone (PQQ) biosynthesis protein C
MSVLRGKMLGFQFVLPTDDVEQPYREQLDLLAGSVSSHKALDNKFYRIWRASVLNLPDFQVFAVNYFMRVYSTPTRISLALAAVGDWQSRIQLLHNLSDELGHGERANVHVLVLYRWLDALSRALGSAEEFRTTLNQARPLPQTERFVDVANDLYRRNTQEMVGALLAQEWQGYTQIAYLCDGFQNYRHLFDTHSFHDLSEYFYVHLGRAEKDHMAQALTIAARHCHSDRDFALISKGFSTYMDLLQEFWDGIVHEFSGYYLDRTSGGITRIGSRLQQRAV